MRRKIVFMILLFLASLTGITVQALDIIETFTEPQFNAMVAGKVFPSPTFTASNITVDFKPGKILVKGTVTRTQGGSFKGEVLIMPTVENGQVTWTALSGKVNGVSVSPTQLAGLSEPLLTVWRSYINTKHPGAYINWITLTDSMMTISIYHHSHG